MKLDFASFSEVEDGTYIALCNGSQHDRGGELLGDATRGADRTLHENGFLALAEYDDNKDNQIDTKDEVFSKLVLRPDANRNGITDNGELLTISEKGVMSVDLSYKEIARIDQYGNAALQKYR